MKSGDRQDPTLLILIVLGAVIVAAWQTVASLSPGQVLSALARSRPSRSALSLSPPRWLCSGFSPSTARCEREARW
jgi:hypothetical protein